MTTTNAPQRRRQAGPPLGVLAVVFAALFIASLVLGTLLASGKPYPSPFGPAADILAYFRDHQHAVQVSAALQFAAAIPLAIYTATASARLHQLGVRAPGATITLIGGALSAGFLALCGLLGWVTSQPEVLDEPALVRALQFLTFATGGVGHVVPLGLLIAGVAVPGLLARLLPRWLAWSGLAIAAVAEIATVSLLIDNAAILLPIARFTGLVWLITAGFRLPRQRPSRAENASN
ncbi:hypothetical protein ONA91_29150 [Micromonospora sp. DR5-3]|uniref:hypothetical protein n=1 Tax=unclassified Micromonospora TaxID=2617518 RepID=UPI0011D487EF|nr:MULTISPECIES: hypothetical protein [unclassified Micromonospora]MCW3818513.1 hypothetical protein [Micromonospora sp. DR5-3]TYC20703.1 hypothetical protein FXF52_29825 [Micromonospora sp. MP36]